MNKEGKLGMASAMVAAALMSGMDSPRGPHAPNAIEANGVKREYHPWDTIQLTKLQRRGKTPAEQQALRKAMWEAAKDPA